MTYDDSSNATLLYNFMGNVPGTWIWEGSNWTLKTSGSNSNPDPGRFGPVMTFDPATRHVVMFGGFSQGGGNVSTMWSWRGQAWASLGVDAPFQRTGVIAAGNVDGKTLLACLGAPSQTWVWDGSHWTQLHPTHNPPAAGQMFADPKSGRVLMWGIDFMRSSVMQFWAWDGADWSQIA
jgi:hypothetical protein